MGATTTVVRQHVSRYVVVMLAGTLWVSLAAIVMLLCLAEVRASAAAYEPASCVTRYASARSIRRIRVVCALASSDANPVTLTGMVECAHMCPELSGPGVHFDGAIAAVDAADRRVAPPESPQATRTYAVRLAAAVVLEHERHTHQLTITSIIVVLLLLALAAPVVAALRADLRHPCNMCPPQPRRDAPGAVRAGRLSRGRDGDGDMYYPGRQAERALARVFGASRTRRNRDMPLPLPLQERQDDADGDEDANPIRDSVLPREPVGVDSDVQDQLDGLPPILLDLLTETNPRRQHHANGQNINNNNNDDDDDDAEPQQETVVWMQKAPPAAVRRKRLGGARLAVYLVMLLLVLGMLTITFIMLQMPGAVVLSLAVVSVPAVWLLLLVGETGNMYYVMSEHRLVILVTSTWALRSFATSARFCDLPAGTDVLIHDDGSGSFALGHTLGPVALAFEYIDDIVEFQGNLRTYTPLPVPPPRPRQSAVRGRRGLVLRFLQLHHQQQQRRAHRVQEEDLEEHGSGEAEEHGSADEAEEHAIGRGALLFV